MRRANLKSILYALGLLAALAFLWRTLQTTPRATPGGGSKKPAAQEAKTGGPDTSGSRRVQAAPDDAALKRYQVIIARNIFAPPAPPAPKTSSVPPFPSDRNTGIIIIPPVKTGPPPPPPPASLAGWEYAGYFAVDGAKKAVLQNKNNTSAKFLATGEEFQGWKVESISGEQVVLAAGATRTTLERPRDFPVVPLEGMTAQAPRAGAAGAPGGGGMRGRGGG